MAGKFEIYQDKGGAFQYRLKSGNGEIVLTGESYQQKSSCENGIESVRINAPMDERYEKKTSNDGKPYFVLKAANHQVIGQSQTYSSESARDGGIDAVKRAVDGAQVANVEVGGDTNRDEKKRSSVSATNDARDSVDDGRSPWLRRGH